MADSPAPAAPAAPSPGPTHESVLLRVLIAVGSLYLVMFSGLLDGRCLRTPWCTIYFDRGAVPLGLAVLIAFLPDVVRLVRARRAAAAATTVKKAPPRNPFDVMIQLLQDIKAAVERAAAPPKDAPTTTEKA